MRVKIDNVLKISEREMAQVQFSLRNANETLAEMQNYASAATHVHVEHRFALVDEKLYIWKRDTSPDRLATIYGNMYYYFKPTVFNTILESARRSLGLEIGAGRRVESHLSRLMRQMLPEGDNERCINGRTKRVRGDHLQIINDLSGKSLSDPEGHVSRVTGFNGQGGIGNPRFPEGENMKIAFSRLVATIISDGTIELNGVIKYAESARGRIDRVVENVQKFGEINPPVKYVQREHHHLLHLPFVLGKALEYLGVPTGDRTIQNPRLPRTVREGTQDVKRSYIGDFLSQDGCIGQNMAIWHRANALDGGTKNKKYGFQPRVGLRDKAFVKENGRKEHANAEAWALAWGKLEALTSSSDVSTARKAMALKKIVLENPNRLLIDEAEIMRSWGIRVATVPSTIKYYPGTGRMSVVWQGRTRGLRDAIKLSIVAPPQDIAKRRRMQSMITEHPKETRESLTHLTRGGIQCSKWWEEP